MKKIERSPEPSIIKECRNGNFLTKEKIREVLGKDTNGCCAYCNAGNILATCPEIEHFYPKSHFPSKACKWENLFLSCSKCNWHKSAKYNGTDEHGKVGKLEHKPLKPDDSAYKFEDNFTIDIFTGKIEPKNDRAKTTIDFFDLNGEERNSARKNELELYQKTGFYVNYAFFIEEYISIMNYIKTKL